MSHKAVKEAQASLFDGEGSLFSVFPIQILSIIDKAIWSDERDKQGNTFTTFTAFVEAKLPYGLETRWDDLKEICKRAVSHAQEQGVNPKHYEECVKRLREVEPELGGHGGDVKSDEYQGDNITLKRGTNATYTERRIKRDRPDLFQKIVDGDLTANSAAIEAGFRKKYYQIEATKEAVVAFCEKHGIEL